uniref:Uncharacterized protein n=1 Tax=Solanum lycopersicum TaxID=4081 RepID=A0A3Q7FKP5_SOLLC
MIGKWCAWRRKKGLFLFNFFKSFSFCLYLYFLFLVLINHNSSILTLLIFVKLTHFIQLGHQVATQA